MKDYYYLLGLKQTASLDEIKDSYRRLSKKFHPDVNDGDAFFAERFKDIQEAYEVLSNLERRKVYDLKYSKRSESSSNSVSNFSPEIEFFTADKNGIHIGDEITFKWKTINADVVLLEPLGPVNPIGTITYRIKNVKINKIQFKLVANNLNINRKIEKEIVVNNLTYDEIYKDAYDDIKREMNKSSESRKSQPIFDSFQSDENSADIPETIVSIGKVIFLFVIALTAIWVIIASFSGKPW